MDEIQEYYNKARTKFKHSKVLYEIEGYADSVSLSYYSMLLIAKALLLKKGLKPKTHSGLISVFGKEYVRNDDFSLKVFSNFSRTEPLRNNSDYDAIDEITKEDAKNAIGYVEDFFKEAERFL